MTNVLSYVQYSLFCPMFSLISNVPFLRFIFYLMSNVLSYFQCSFFAFNFLSSVQCSILFSMFILTFDILYIKSSQALWSALTDLNGLIADTLCHSHLAIQTLTLSGEDIFGQKSYNYNVLTSQWLTAGIWPVGRIMKSM